MSGLFPAWWVELGRPSGDLSAGENGLSWVGAPCIFGQQALQITKILSVLYEATGHVPGVTYSWFLILAKAFTS